MFRLVAYISSKMKTITMLDKGHEAENLQKVFVFIAFEDILCKVFSTS